MEADAFMTKSCLKPRLRPGATGNQGTRRLPPFLADCKGRQMSKQVTGCSRDEGGRALSKEQERWKGSYTGRALCVMGPAQPDPGRETGEAQGEAGRAGELTAATG